jgi:hypothetical protein
LALLSPSGEIKVLYFSVDPKAEYSCDGTQLQVVITRAEAD